MQTCKQCRYFEFLKNGNDEPIGFGICLSLPPEVVSIVGVYGYSDGLQSVHPQVSEKRTPCVHFREKGKQKLLS